MISTIGENVRDLPRLARIIMMDSDIDDTVRLMMDMLEEDQSDDDDDDEDDDDDDDDRGPVRIQNFVEDTVPRYSNTEFREHFRMTRAVFEVWC